MHLHLLSTLHFPRTTLPQARLSVHCDDAHRTQRRTEDILPRLPLPSHVNSITSPSNPFVKHCLKLRQSSTYRHFHGSALVVGTTPIREIHRFQDSIQRATTMDCLLLLDGTEVPKELYNSPIRIVRVSSVVMKKLSGVQSIDSIKAAALMRFPPSFCNMDDKQREANCRSWFPSPHRVLVLDGIQDPGNLGTLLRSAMAFRWDGVFLLPGCCDPFNEKVIRAARGASFQLPIVSGNWGHLETLAIEFKMKFLAGHPEITTELKSSLLSQKLADSLADSPLCLVLGSEGHGLSAQSKEVCKLVSIPMMGKFESLNVSVAGSQYYTTWTVVQMEASAIQAGIQKVLNMKLSAVISRLTAEQYWIIFNKSEEFECGHASIYLSWLHGKLILSLVGVSETRHLRVWALSNPPLPLGLPSMLHK